MVEVAISLAIIGIALVAIIGVLPLGMNVQRDNRELTVVNQDATVFLEAISKGSRGMDDLTNYVYAITNFQTFYNSSGNPSATVTFGYTNYPSYLTNGANIIGLLSTPEYTTDQFSNAIPSLIFGGYSNHIVASVRSLSGPAVEKPPQDNDIIRSDAFSYRIYCVNAPVAAYMPPAWQPQAYNDGDIVSYVLYGNRIFWHAVNAGQPLNPPQASDIPGSSPRWVRDNYPQELDANLRELRLTFLWPVRPNGRLGNGHQTYRTLVSGQILQTTNFGQTLYFYQPQSFTAAP